MACAEFIIKQRLICFHSINSVFNILGSSISTEGRRRKPSPFSHCFSSAGCALWVGDFRLPALCAMTWLHAKLCSILAHVQYQQASRSKWRKQKLNHYSMFLVYKERYCPPTQSVINAKSFANLGLSFSLSDLRLCILPGSCCFGDVMNSLTRSCSDTMHKKGLGMRGWLIADEEKVLSWGETENKTSLYLSGFLRSHGGLGLAGCHQAVQSHRDVHPGPVYLCSPDLLTIANVVSASASLSSPCGCFKIPWEENGSFLKETWNMAMVTSVH